ncbi:Dynein light chain Tctex-type [Dermatophagoides pteronyssinus]|uniref:Dynein light chain Tctex-type n=1 Tax=Dermatophagoides pteronyssinus TaxID=6956 RepID=A0ABQ8IYG4_DERPT|nr:Dynein light chain Tctex-type [Dermatophagoides pteronyssinus]
MDTDNNDEDNDVYKRALESIKQIENEILFMLDQSNLNTDDDDDNNLKQQQFPSKTQTTTKTIIEQQQRSQILNEQNINLNGGTIPSTNDDHQQIFNNNNNNNDKFNWISDKKHSFINGSSSSTSTSRSSSTSSHGQIVNNNNNNNLGKHRYSFYDNSEKLPVYLVHSSELDELISNHSPTSTSTTNELPVMNDFIQLQLQNNGRILPDSIENAIIYLLKFGRNSLGIFRKSGVKSRIQILREKIQQQEINFEITGESVYDVADLLKQWLRDLRPHLLTNELIDMFIMAKKSKNNHQFEFYLWHLDDCHRYLLFIILKFLSLIAANSSTNQMTIQNLAICFAPSLCNGENEKQINRGQKCLQYCIENYESLFYLNIINGKRYQRQLSSTTTTSSTTSTTSKTTLNHEHTSVIIINASPDDILARLLYERNMIDKLISRWTIIDHDPEQNSDHFEFDLQFSCLLPTKTFNLKRKWSNSIEQPGGFKLLEQGDSIQSNWIMVPNGKGQTLVKHDISMELRGLSSKWYRHIFPTIHDQQLKRLASSFTIIPMNGTRISEV